MDVRFSASSAMELPCDMLAIAVGEDLEADLAALDAKLDGAASGLATARSFKGKRGTALNITPLGAVPAREIVVLGVGDGSIEAVRAAAARAGREARAARARTLVLDLGASGLDVASALESVAFGNYVFDRYKREEERAPALETTTLAGVAETAETKAAAARFATRARYQAWARDLVNGTPAEISPAGLEAEARKLADLPHVEVEVWDAATCEARGLVGIVAVGQGSSVPGRLIRVQYRPAGARGHIALVGKGVTFDAGGLSIKPTAGMLTMRCDMGGAAVALGAIGAIAELGIPLAVDCYVGAVENLLSGDSYKLGDVLTYNNGVTVEIHNTDAEGRLVLADCLIEACKDPDVTHVIDLATLTGACLIALGSDFTGMFTHDDDLAAELHAAASADGEGLWRLPLHEPYKELLKADWAQIKNVGGRTAGATTAALFLSHFVSEDVRWVHLDVAGSAWRDTANTRCASGGTGEMVRTLTRWAAALAE